MTDIAHYQPVGRFDATTIKHHEAELRRLLDAGAHSIELDFSGIEFLSSAGLRVLLVTANLTEVKGGSLRLKGTRTEIREVILTVGFDDILQLID